jgi:tight adherence protein C
VSRAVWVLVVPCWIGLTLLLSEVRWFARVPLTGRLTPYVPGGMATRPRTGPLSAESFRAALEPLAWWFGAALARLFGVREDLDRRLRRAHTGMDGSAFRLRQVGWSVLGLGLGATAGVAAPAPGSIRALLPLGGLLLPFLLLEHQVATASERWRRSVHLELPVVAEQLGMLLGAGYSLVGALDRVARRGSGAVATDLKVVLSRIRQGMSEEQALREWVQLIDVRAAERLVSVLGLNREASDLGRLIAAEARSIRRDVHREVLELLERRAQQVWIPVTVATLVPGVIFIAIPFTAALADFIG